MRVFYDVDTQNDFMNANGALYVPGAEGIKSNLALLTRYAESKRIPVLGSVDRHFGTEEYKERELELARWGGPFPDHCMIETKGWEKINETTLNGKYPQKGGKWPASLYLPNPLINREGYVREHINEALKEITDVANHKTQDGVYFEKQSYDVFTNPAVEVFLRRANVTEAVVYGVATDYCVKAAVLGMQQRGIQCYVVEDAIRGVFPESTRSALEEMAAAGAKFVKTQDVLEGRI